MPWYCGYEPEGDYDHIAPTQMEYDGHIYDAETGEEIAQILNEVTARHIVDLYNAAEEAEKAKTKVRAAATPAPNGKLKPWTPGTVTELNYQLCHACGTGLTRGQYAYSSHQFGQPLCPAHQPRTAATAA